MRQRTLLGAAVAVALATAPAGAAFPDGFVWGTATAGFQNENGGSADDPGSDWWVWVHDPDNIADGRVSGDLPEAGPASWDLYRKDLSLARKGRSNAVRLGIEWSRIFPTSTAAVPNDPVALDAVADPAAVAHYRDVLKHARRRRLTPFVTVTHFSLPLWIHDPIAARDAFAAQGPDDPPPTGFPAGWVDPATVTEFAKYAAYLGWKLGDLVDVWTPLNEPVVVGVQGYVNLPGVLSGNFPPGAFSFAGVIEVLKHEAAAQAVGYDALKAWDTVDADGDGVAAVVGLVHNMAALHPKDPGKPLDVTGAAHADYLFHRLFLNAVVHGDLDANANGVIDPGEHRPELAGKADFIGVNYYLRGVIQGLGFSVTPLIPLLDFLPTIGYATPENPSLPPCPSTCSDFGWEIYPQGLREVLDVAASYGLPLYVTENGIADADDDRRPSYLVRHLTVLEQAIADGLDVRGYFHWTLVDNFEWSAGYHTRFGLHAFDPVTKKRRPRRSAKYFAQICRRDDIPQPLRVRFGP